MKVLFVTTSFPRFENDFVGSFVFRFAKYLVEAGVDVTALAPGAPGIDNRGEIDGVNIVRFTYFLPRGKQRLCYEDGGILANLRRSLLANVQLPFMLLFLVLSIRRLCRQADVIHCHWLPTVWAVWLAKRLAFSAAPIVFTNWGSDTRLFPKWAIRLSLKAIDRVVSTAVETDRHLQAVGYEHFERVMAPVDEDRFGAATDPAPLLAELGVVEDGPPIISFVGRLNYFKDPLTFIRSCQVLRKTGVPFLALMAGDGDLRKDCERLIENLDIGASVRLLGVRYDVEQLFAASAATVHISPVENTWASSIAEAMFTHCPVLLSDAGYTRSTFTHLEDCYIARAGDPESIAAGLKALIEDRTLAERLTEGALGLLKRHGKYKDTITRQMIDIYRGLATG